MTTESTGPAAASAFNVKADKRVISVMGDGGFWHNGLASSIGNAVFNKHDGVFVIVDNYYTSATGGQDILSSRAINRRRNNMTWSSWRKTMRSSGTAWPSRLGSTWCQTV